MGNFRTGNTSKAGFLVAGGAISTQFGAAFATRLFHSIGPTGAVSLRIGFAALALLVVNLPNRDKLAKVQGRGRDIWVAIAFGVVLGAMNLTFYEAIARIPLGVAVTIEFVGPLGVTIGGSRRLMDLAWAALAGIGVGLLAGRGLLGGEIRHLNLLGVGYALLSGVCWAGYILLNSASGRRFRGTTGLSIAMVAATIVILPFGIVRGGWHLLSLDSLWVGFLVALLSSALPYSLEMYALKRVTSRAFGILLSLEPVFAALAGLLVLGQRLDMVEVAALVMVIVANLGSAWFDSNRSAIVVDI